MGARTIPAKTAPMPTTAKAPMESAGVVKDSNVDVADRTAQHSAHEERRRKDAARASA